MSSWKDEKAPVGGGGGTINCKTLKKPEYPLIGNVSRFK